MKSNETYYHQSVILVSMRNGVRELSLLYLTIAYTFYMSYFPYPIRVIVNIKSKFIPNTPLVSNKNVI